MRCGCVAISGGGLDWRRTSSPTAPERLHRGTVRAALIAVLPAWLSRPIAGQQKYGPLALLEELCAVDNTVVTDPQARSHLDNLATGRSKTAAIARRLLDRGATAAPHHPDAGTWPAEALAIALNIRIERAER